MATVNINGKTYHSRWNKGDMVGRLKVAEEPVHRAPRNPSGKKPPRRQWYYTCTCTCGATDVEKSQDSMLNSRVMCDKCAILSRSDSRPVTWYGIHLPEGVPNFLTMPPPASITSKPETYRCPI